MAVQVAIVGAGFSGLGMAIRLAGAGRDDFVILEAAEEVGGTWRDNTYPGAACDIPSRLYSLSFAPSTTWTGRYPRQPEIQAYLKALVDRFQLRDRLRLNTCVEKAVWEGTAWRLHLSDGSELCATHVVFGIGALRIPKYPNVPGRTCFSGPTLHSAKWKPTDLSGMRVGVVGTGSSAVQLVPELAKTVKHLTLFQRTPPWVRERQDRSYGAVERALVTHVPGLERALRWRRYWVHERRYPTFFGPAHRVGKLAEPVLKFQLMRAAGRELSRQVMPDYRFGCKRILLGENWYETLRSSHVSIVTEPVSEVVPDGVIAGEHHELDALIWCTGFQVRDPLGKLEVFGTEGRSLRDVWGARPHALRGIQVPGFPNSYLLLGPNTALGHNSVVIMIEAQIRYVLDALDRADEHGPIDARPEALEAWLKRVDRRHEHRVWSSGCDSWYLGEDRVNFTLFPGSTVRYVLETRKVWAEEVVHLRGRTS